MDVVIPLTKCRDNFELRYALRSFDKWYSPDRVVLVGGCPEWFNGEHIEHDDYHALFKEKNIHDKVKKGAALLGGDFMMCNDDHFALAPYPGLHHKGKLKNTLKGRNLNGTYGRLLINTIEWFGDVDNYDTHCPMVMNLAGILNIKVDWSIHNGFGFKTSYVYSNGLSGTYFEDAKYHTIPKTINRPYFSISESCSNLNYLSKLFPTKCKWEK